MTHIKRELIRGMKQKKFPADEVRQMRYGEAGYFWIDQSDGTNVVLLGSDTEGTNRMETKDAKGYQMVKEIIRVAVEDGGGVVTPDLVRCAPNLFDGERIFPGRNASIRQTAKDFMAVCPACRYALKDSHTGGLEPAIVSEDNKILSTWDTTVSREAARTTSPVGKDRVKIRWKTSIFSPKFFLFQRKAVSLRSKMDHYTQYCLPDK